MLGSSPHGRAARQGGGSCGAGEAARDRAANRERRSVQPRQASSKDRHENAALRAQLVQLKHDLAEQERGNEQLRLANAHLERALASEKLQNRELLGSNSWRLTSPLRGVVGAGRSFCNAIRRAVGLDPTAGFFREGFLAPVDLLPPAQCRRILDHYRQAPSLQEERKALAAKDRVFYDMATQPALLGLLRRLLREDIVLWGSKVIGQKPGQEHVWHTDIESSAIDGGFVSVWIGLENASEASGLRLISRSHKFSKPIQQAAHERGLRREQITDEYVAAWASEHDRHARLIRGPSTAALSSSSATRCRRCWRPRSLTSSRPAWWSTARPAGRWRSGR